MKTHAQLQFTLYGEPAKVTVYLKDGALFVIVSDEDEGRGVGSLCLSGPPLRVLGLVEGMLERVRAVLVLP
jgi:hypothetical protein